MAGTDLINVTKVYTESAITTNGLEERVTLTDFMKLLPAAGAAVAGTQVLVTRQTAPAAAPDPFVSLSTAAQAYNAMRTALIAAGVFV